MHGGSMFAGVRAPMHCCKALPWVQSLLHCKAAQGTSSLTQMPSQGTSPWCSFSRRVK